MAPLYADRTVVRIGLPSKGRMSEQTLSLLKVSHIVSVPASIYRILYLRGDFVDFVLLLCCSCLVVQSCQLSVRHLNPRQYTADIPQVRFPSPFIVFYQFVISVLEIGLLSN